MYNSTKCIEEKLSTWASLSKCQDIIYSSDGVDIFAVAFFFIHSFISINIKSQALISLLYSIDKQIALLSSTKLLPPIDTLVRSPPCNQNRSGFFSKRFSDFYANLPHLERCSMNSIECIRKCTLPEMESNRIE